MNLRHNKVKIIIIIKKIITQQTEPYPLLKGKPNPLKSIIIIIIIIKKHAAEYYSTNILISFD